MGLQELHQHFDRQTLAELRLAVALPERDPRVHLGRRDSASVGGRVMFSNSYNNLQNMMYLL